MSLAGAPNRQELAEQQLEIAIRTYQQAPSEEPGNQRLREIAAEAFAQRGLLATTYAQSLDGTARLLRAVEDYKQAIGLDAGHPQRQAAFSTGLADAYERLHMPREAEDARSEAARRRGPAGMVTEQRGR